MNTAFPEVWLSIPRWSHYQISDRGHIRRRPKGGRLIAKTTTLQTNVDGYQTVTLVRGSKEITVPVDTLVCQTFYGKMPSKGMTIQHVDGVNWNNWASNIRWEYPIVSNRWYSGPIDAARRGYFKYGPLKSKTEILPNLCPGDVIVAFDDNAKIIAFEFVFSRDATKSTLNPFDLARYWRATVNSLTQAERCRGMDMPVNPNANPYEAAARYRKLAEMHPDYMWATYLLEAAFYIERIADYVYKGVPPPAIVIAPAVRRSLDLPRAAPVAAAQAPTAPPVVARRSLTMPPAPAPRPAPAMAPSPRRRSRNMKTPGLLDWE